MDARFFLPIFGVLVSLIFTICYAALGKCVRMRHGDERTVRAHGLLQGTASMPAHRRGWSPGSRGPAQGVRAVDQPPFTDHRGSAPYGSVCHPKMKYFPKVWKQINYYSLKMNLFINLLLLRY